MTEKIDPELFKPLDKEEVSTVIARPTLSYWQDA